jgi:hypothetical protein
MLVGRLAVGPSDGDRKRSGPCLPAFEFVPFWYLFVPTPE